MAERMAGEKRCTPKMVEIMRPPGNHEAQLVSGSNLDRIFMDFWLKLKQILQQSDSRPPSSSHPPRQPPPDPQQWKAAPGGHKTKKWQRSS
ncbi:Hypothetical predicted protein, partial [Pelobates cultripes]